MEKTRKYPVKKLNITFIYDEEGSDLQTILEEGYLCYIRKQKTILT
jgi:hypothetical protein